MSLAVRDGWSHSQVAAEDRPSAADWQAYECPQVVDSIVRVLDGRVGVQKGTGLVDLEEETEEDRRNEDEGGSPMKPLKALLACISAHFPQNPCACPPNDLKLGATVILLHPILALRPDPLQRAARLSGFAQKVPGTHAGSVSSLM